MSDEGRGKPRGRLERFQARPPEAGEDQRNERKLRKMASGTAGPANVLGLGRRQPVGRRGPTVWRGGDRWPDRSEYRLCQAFACPLPLFRRSFFPARRRMLPLQGRAPAKASQAVQYRRSRRVRRRRFRETADALPLWSGCPWGSTPFKLAMLAFFALSWIAVVKRRAKTLCFWPLWVRSERRHPQLSRQVNDSSLQQTEQKRTANSKDPRKHGDFDVCLLASQA